MNRNSNIVMGAVFIAIGILFLLSNLGYVNFSLDYLWPLALLIPGIYMHFAFFTGLDKNAGILVPAGILTTYGALFYANVFGGWHMMTELWPFFLIGVAIGLFELYLFGGRNKSLLIPVAILGGFGGLKLFNNLINIDVKDYVVPALLIAVGLVIISKRDNGKKSNPKE